jgi:hypothetical protein
MSVRDSLPAIDLKNDWLNKDRELYTLIFVKTSVGIALNGINVVLGDDSLSNASGRSLGVVFSGLLEMANVSTSRYFIELSHVGDPTRKGETAGTTLIYALTIGGLVAINDYALNSRFVHIPVPQIPPLAQIDNYIVNPLHAGMVRIFLPPDQVIARNSTVPIQRVLAGLSIVNNLIGSLAVTAGIVATQATRL